MLSLISWAAAGIILAYALMVLNGMGRRSCWISRTAHIFLAVGAFSGVVERIGFGGARMLLWSNTLLLVGTAALVIALGVRHRRFLDFGS